MYTYKQSIMKHVIDNNIVWYKESDIYTRILSLPYMIVLFIIGFIIALVIDFIATIFSC